MLPDIKYNVVKYLKLDFLKNKTEDGGAQNAVLSSLKPTERPIHIHSSKYGRMWANAEPERILKLIEKNIGLYEVLNSYPLKVYFDIDKVSDLTPNDLTKYKEIIKKYIPDAEMAISGSETTEKHSYHITLNNYIINNDIERENLKLFVKDILFNEDNGFDWKVYTKNRNMKAINQSKINKPIQQIIEQTDMKKHLITCFIDTTAKSLSNLPKLEHTKQNNKLDILTLPKLNKPHKMISLDEIKSSLDVLKLLPINKEFDHRYTHMIARFCYHNDIQFNDFFEWYKAKNDTNEAKNKWAKKWETLGDTKKITKDYLKLILEKYYNGVGNSSELNKFIEMTDISAYPFEEIERLEPEHFNKETKSIIFKIGMGGGKTAQTIDYLKKQTNQSTTTAEAIKTNTESTNKTFIWMTPNIALATNTHGRMTDNKINDVFLYNTEKKEKQTKLIADSSNLMICMNSLKKVKKTYNIVVIDEIESFLKKWCFNSTLEGIHGTCYNTFVNILKNADKIILLDAFITKITIDFLNDLNINFSLITRKNDKSYNNRVAQKFAQSKNMISDAINQLKLGKKLFIFYPFCKGNKTNMGSDDFVKVLEKYSGKKGIGHNGDSGDDVKNKLKDVNNTWSKYDFVVSNNVITVGVNFDEEYFDQCYLFPATFNEMRDIVQFSYRPRALKEKIVKFCLMHSYSFDNTSKLDKYCQVVSPEYENLRKNVLTECTAPKDKILNEFLIMAGYKICPDLVEISKRELKTIELIKSSESYYDYDKIEEFDPCLLKDVETEFYSNNCSFETKLMLRKHHYENKFNIDVEREVKAEIWNNNYLNLVEDVRDILIGNSKLMDKLKAEYSWELHFPDEITDFKFNKDMLKSIFDAGLCSTKLNDTSSHPLILKTYINHYFNSEVFKSNNKQERTKGKVGTVNFEVDDKFKRIYILIKDNLKQPTFINNVDNIDIEFIDDEPTETHEPTEPTIFNEAIEPTETHKPIETTILNETIEQPDIIIKPDPVILPNTPKPKAQKATPKPKAQTKQQTPEQIEKAEIELFKMLLKVNSYTTDEDLMKGANLTVDKLKRFRKYQQQLTPINTDNLIKYNDIQIKMDVSPIKKYIDDVLKIECHLIPKVLIKKDGKFNKLCIYGYENNNTTEKPLIIIQPDERTYSYGNKTKFINDNNIIKLLEAISNEGKKTINNNI